MFKRFNAFLVLVLLMASTFNFQTAVAASSDPINGATANVDFAYLMIDDEDFIDNYTSELNEDDGDEARLLGEEFEPELYYYIGVGSPFDRLYFDIERGAEYHADIPDFEWEYNDGGTWRDLDVKDSTIDDFREEGDSYIEFEFDENWEEAEIMESDAYWVRLSTDEERIEGEGAYIDQISARAFTLKLSVEDDRGDEVTGLTESDFEFSSGSDNDIHEFINLGRGDYFLALNADADDVHYTMTIDDSSFEEESWTVKVSSYLFEFSIELDDEDDDDEDEDEDEDEDDDDDDDDDEDEDDDDDVNDDNDVIGGATADFDHVFTHNDALRNVTHEASDDDGDEFRLFDDSDGLQYLYMGMDSVFDEIYFDIDEAVDFDGRGDIDWEYYSEDDGWEDLRVDDDELNDFDETGIVMVDFDIPSDWDTHSFNSERAYWVRVSTRDDIDDEGKIEQISARAYTVKIDVIDEDEDKVEDLTKSDFEVDGGTKDVIYGFFEKKDGLYYLALMADAKDVSYKVTIDDSKYEDETVSVVAKTSARTYDVELEDNSRKISSSSSSSSYSSDCESDFRDTRYHYSFRAVDELYCMGALDGYTRSYYRPDYRMTRAEYLKMLLLGADVDPDDYSGYEDFRDVNSDDWHYEYVVAALELDMIDDKRYFYPNRYITRAEAVTMLIRLADLNTYYWGTPFTDVPDYSWFAPYVATAYNNYLVRGYGDQTFKPAQVLTRGEGAVMTYNAINELWE